MTTKLSPDQMDIRVIDARMDLLAGLWRSAYLEGIQTGLKAAAEEIWDGSRFDRVGATLSRMRSILDLDPEDIARRAD